MNRQQRRAAAKQGPGPVGLATGGANPSHEKVSALFGAAVAHQRSGRLAEAERICRQILEIEPNHSDAHHCLGVLAFQVGRCDIAAAFIANAIALKGDEPTMHSNLGNALKGLGKLDEAIASYRRAIALRADFADAYSNLGNALGDQGRPDDAIESYRRALAINPRFVDAHKNLGNALLKQGKLSEAAASYAKALALNPNAADAHNNLGVTLKDWGKLDEAAASYRKALAINPDYVDARINLGNLFREREDPDGAVVSYRQALAIEPNNLDAHHNLATALGDQCKFGEAIESYRFVLAREPNLAEAHNNLANVLKHQGRLDAALESYERVIALKPDFAGAHGNLLLTQHYADGISNAELLAAARRFGDQFDRKAEGEVFSNDRSLGRRLRIGYVSGDFQQHPVGFLLARVLEAHDRAAFEIFCYANSTNVDHVTERLKKAADHWRSIVGVSDADAEAMIKRDRIDILVDLSGHTAKSRLLLFTRRPAPVQASWLGYFGTTGLRSIDYLVMDEATVPAGEERWFTEAVVRLPYGRFCYAPPEYAPDPVDPPSLKRGYVTFGSFNNVAKIGAGVISLWAAVLQATPGSRLLLKWKSFDNEGVRRRFGDAFRAAGVVEERLELRGFSPHREMLAQYGDIDIALDPFPFGGGLTSCEALWMGAPVATLPGDRPASRQTIGFLNLLGLSDCVAHSPTEYVSCATALAADSDRLMALRHSLRRRMTASPLCDGARFTPTLETAFRQMWNRWRAGEPAASFEAQGMGERNPAEAA
ncbi:tetratricopeptide repeat protein [Methylocapsa sp. S129]|uniref:tetratricopeptide repeat protein n=1 Tax=Methylocapsa sp. S129 TaxID=1641869 RepID=UPI00131D1A81|nr:tetratricopeptide repeat protein [Methylocapsa sp. S129]